MFGALRLGLLSRSGNVLSVVSPAGGRIRSVHVALSSEMEFTREWLVIVKFSSLMDEGGDPTTLTTAFSSSGHPRRKDL